MRADRVLIERCRDADRSVRKSAKRELLERYEALVYALSKSFAGRCSLADLCQEIWKRIFTAIEKGIPIKSSLSGWIWHKAVGIGREWVKERPLLPEMIHDFTADMHPASAAVDSLDPLVACELWQEYQFLLAAAAKLEERDLDLIIWCWLEERSIKDVAQLIGQAEGTVKSRKHRAMEKLRQLFFQERGEPDGGEPDDR